MNHAGFGLEFIGFCELLMLKGLRRDGNQQQACLVFLTYKHSWTLIKVGVCISPWATKYSSMCFHHWFTSCLIWVPQRVLEEQPVCIEGGRSTQPGHGAEIRVQVWPPESAAEECCLFSQTPAISDSSGGHFGSFWTYQGALSFDYGLC